MRDDFVVANKKAPKGCLLRLLFLHRRI